jgi:hypothetical protein
MSSTQKLTCFVIAPIGDKDSDFRKHSDKVLKHIFKKALSEKYDAKRADEINEPGMITSQILRAIQDFDLVVADLTFHNPNVFYELAVRHAIEKPIIHLIEPRLSKIPFDVSGFRTIEFDLTDPDSIESAVEQLKKQADQSQAGKWGETPIRLAQIMRPRKDDSPELVLLKQALEGISDIAARLTNLENPSIPSLPSEWLSNLKFANLNALSGSIPGPPRFGYGSDDLPAVRTTEEKKKK